VIASATKSLGLAVTSEAAPEKENGRL